MGSEDVLNGDWSLARGALVLSYVASDGVLTLTRGGARLPWHIDLATDACLGVSAGGVVTEHPIRLAALTMRRLPPARLQWLGEVAGAGVALEVALKDEAVIFSVSPLCTGPNPVVSATWPGTICGQGTARETVWSDYHQGFLFRADGQPWERRAKWGHSTLRVGGMTCDGATLALIIETPYDAESRLSDDGRQAVSHRIEFGPSLGELSYPRRLRVVPTPEPGHVAVTRVFRDYVRAHGMWMSWEERVATMPAVARLKGAFFGFAGYLHDADADIVGAMRKMRAYGFERGYIYSPKLRTFDDVNWSKSIGRFNSLTDAQVQDIQALGYLCAPFLQVEQAATTIGEQLLARDAQGQPIKRWQIGDTNYYEIMKWRVPGMLPRLDDETACAQAIHFDTLTVAPLVEHWGNRSYDRTGDIRWRREIARYYRRRGKVIGAEGLRDWANDVTDIATARHFVPRLGPRAGPASGDDRVWVVPLTDLVYHDSCVRIVWEHWYYHDTHTMYDHELTTWHPFAMELMDLLTASPPVLFPEGKQYYFVLEPVTYPDGHIRFHLHWDQPRVYQNRFSDPAFQEALPKALRVCRQNARHGTAQMVTHRYLDSASPLIQESEFATGLHVVANFSDADYTLADGRTVPARSALTED